MERKKIQLEIFSKCGGVYPKSKFVFLKGLKKDLRLWTTKLELNSLVKGLKYIRKNKRRMYLIKRFRGVVNVKEHKLPSNMHL